MMWFKTTDRQDLAKYFATLRVKDKKSAALHLFFMILREYEYKFRLDLVYKHLDFVHNRVWLASTIPISPVLNR